MDASSSPPDLSLDQLVELERRAAEREAELAAADDPPAGAGDDPPDVVLPWWQNPINIVTLIVTAALLAGMIGWMVGDTRSAVRHNDVDTGFLQDMRNHHDQAVLMAYIFRTRPDVDPGLNTVARNIITGQNQEIGRMVQLLRDFGETESNETGVAMTWMGMSTDIDDMPGMATDAQLDALGSARGREADELFVELMTAHHEGGIEMAEYAAERGENAEIEAMSTAMAAGQRSEIVEMESLLD